MEDQVDGGAVDFMAEFASRLPLDVACELLGAPKDLDHLRSLVTDFSWTLELGAGEAELATADTAGHEMLGRFSDLVVERRATPGDDLISDLVRAADSDAPQLSEEELLANLVMLLVAGSQTVTHWIGNMLALIFERVDIADQLRSGELDTAAFTEESLRYDSPAQIIPRVTSEDVNIEGLASLPRGTGILLALGGANRDPDHYERPDEFDPRRVDGQPLSFGFGVHFCLGARLSRMEANAAIAHLLTRFPRLSPAGTPVRSDRTVLRGYDTFPVSLH
jgi:cytochrome P450